MLWLLLELFMHPGIQKKLTLVLTDELMAEISDDSGLTLGAFFSKHVSHGECFMDLEGFHSSHNGLSITSQLRFKAKNSKPVCDGQVVNLIESPGRQCRGLGSAEQQNRRCCLIQAFPV